MIDMQVDATTGHEIMSFLDAFMGYNQILIIQMKMSFMIERGIYCYKVMPFELNLGAT